MNGMKWMKINMVDKIINTKEKILNSLSGEFYVTKVERNDFDSGVSIICQFNNGGQIGGEFEYTLEGGERGIDRVEHYDEKDDEDIYAEIHDWVDENIEWETSVKWNGKELK